jgi:hypothetical protein
VKLISPESLNDLQRRILQGYTRFFPPGSVCVNVMLGEEPWDIRPLLLSLGKVSVARFSMSMSESRARSVARELESFSALFQNRQRVQLLPDEGRFVLLRPYEGSTLGEDLEKGTVSGTPALLEIVRKLIVTVSELSRRGAAHGHISPANMALLNGEVVLLDPVIGALHQTKDLFLAPETSLGNVPGTSADLYSLGRIIKIFIGDALTQRQSALVDQLLLANPQQRPPLLEVAVAFGVQGVGAAQEGEAGAMRGGAGKLVRPGAGAQSPQPTQQPVEVAESEVPVTPKSSGLGSLLLGAVAFAAIGGWYLKSRNPELYYQIAAHVPFLAPEHSAEYASDWASGERARMALVARAAVLRKEPAAINTILEDLLGGANPEGVKGALLRVALAETWRDQLTSRDTNAALALAVAQLVPEGVTEIPPLSSLHPAVILAIMSNRQVAEQAKALSEIKVGLLGKLPEPFGPLFSQLEGMGVQKLGDLQAKGLARIVTGDSSADAFEAYLGEEQEPSKILAKVSTILPVVAANQVSQRDLFGVLKDRGGDLATLCGWFDLLDLARWSKIQTSDKLRLILATSPEGKLDDSQWADLLAFPLGAVRNLAVKSLRGQFPGPDGEKLLVALASPSIGLQREQIIALVSALKLPADKRGPFISAWFNLKPPSDAVLMLLLARSSAASTDLFNLEAARFLRRSSWTAPLELLQLLASHPEPLARAIAYGRLDPSKEAERVVLAARQSAEQDPGCVKVLEERLRGFQR